MRRLWFAMHDSDQDHKQAILIDMRNAKFWNERGFGIFWAVNDFGNGPRQIEHLQKINSWFVEIDHVPKSKQLALIEACPVPPSLVVESKSGYHVYWNARGATIDDWDEVMAGLRFHFSGDPRAKDVARILRVPGFYHMKDRANPFLVQKRWEIDVAYSSLRMKRYFPVPKEQSKRAQVYHLAQAQKKAKILTPGPSDFWDRVSSFDCEEALRRLSGSAFVNYETYEFVRQSTGNLNIMVNGKSTSCFIDREKRIGATHGPTIFQWLKYPAYNHTSKSVIEILKHVCPELYS